MPSEGLVPNGEFGIKKSFMGCGGGIPPSAALEAKGSFVVKLVSFGISIPGRRTISTGQGGAEARQKAQGNVRRPPA